MEKAEHYNHTYDNKRRLASYWHQIDECLTLGGKTVLVVGKGSGLPLYMLARQGLTVTTLDIQPDLRPDILGDVRQMPFVDRTFDVTLCCQVLEHMPFEFFADALCELKRILRRGLVLSLPDRGPYSKIIPRLLRKRTVLTLPSIQLQPWVGKGGHFWEVNTPGCRLHDLQGVIQEVGFEIENTFRVWEYPYHRFWRLRLS
jgi:SAM-dependent methyltransferase